MAVSADPVEKRDLLVARMGLQFPVLSDADLKITQGFGVQQEGCDCALPALFIIDPQNRIHFARIGDNIVDRVNAADILRALTAATAAAAPAVSAPASLPKPK